MFAVAASRGYFLQPIQISALKSDDAHPAHLAKFLLTAMKTAAGNIVRVIVHALAPRKRFQKKTRLLAAAAAEFGDYERTFQARNNIGRIALQQTHSGAAQSIFGQQADYVEERRAHFIIQILGWQLLLAWLPESHDDVR